jgi:hypothetical protein
LKEGKKIQLKQPPEAIWSNALPDTGQDGCRKEGVSMLVVLVLIILTKSPEVLPISLRNSSYCPHQQSTSPLG